MLALVEVVGVLVGLTVFAVLVGATLRWPRPASTDRWASSRSLVLTEESRSRVVHHLGTARRVRVAGSVVGLVLHLIVASVAGRRGGGFVELLAWVVGGYLLGAVYAEAILARPRGKRERFASLVPRELEQYLPRLLRRAVLAAALVAVGLAVAVAFVDFDRAEAVDMGYLSDPVAIGLGALALAGAVLCERVQHWIVARPQPDATPDLREADHAVRAQSVTSVAGAGLALLLLLHTTLWWNLALSDVQVLRWVAWVPAIASAVGALVSWLRFGNWPRDVRRHPVLRPVGEPG